MLLAAVEPKVLERRRDRSHELSLSGEGEEVSTSVLYSTSVPMPNEYKPEQVGHPCFGW